MGMLREIRVPICCNPAFLVHSLGFVPLSSPTTARSLADRSSTRVSNREVATIQAPGQKGEKLRMDYRWRGQIHSFSAPFSSYCTSETTISDAVAVEVDRIPSV